MESKLREMFDQIKMPEECALRIEESLNIS